MFLLPESQGSIKKEQQYFDSVKYYFFDWINLKIDIYKNHLFLINSLDFTYNTIKFQSDFHIIINEFLKNKNLNLYYKLRNQVAIVMKLHKLMMINSMFYVKFDEKNEYFKFNFFPYFSDNDNQFFTNFLNQKEINLEDLTLIKSYIDIESIVYKNNNDFFKNIINEVIFDYFNLITTIIELLLELDSIKYLNTVLSFLIIHYVFRHFKSLMKNKKFRVFAEFRSKINSLEDFQKIEDASQIIAKFLLVLMFQFLVDVINRELCVFLNVDNKNLINLVAFIGHSETPDSNEFTKEINSLIFQKIKQQTESEKSNNLITNFLLKNVISILN